MNRTVRNYIIRIAIMAIISALVIILANSVRQSWAESAEQRGDQEIEQDYDLTLWYYDSALTPYVKQLQEDYFRSQGLRVGCELVSVVSFFENINQKNVEGSGVPDLYITDTTRLEQAYLGSLAKENVFPELYNLQNYSVKALTSVMYNGKQVGYPLCFDMEYFVYNADYMDAPPASFEQIASDSESFEKDSDSIVDMVILYDVADLLYNFHFIGGSVELGGNTGDDDTKVNLESTELRSALESFKNFSTKSRIDMNTTTYDLVENSFIYGRSRTAILKCSSLAAMNREKTNYVICEMPPVSDEIPSKALSNTLCVCVNPSSSNTDAAEKLAQYMTYEKTDTIYSLTGYMSCRRMEYSADGFDQLYLLYDKTASLPKFIETEELWKDMETMFQSIWNGTEAGAAFEEFRSSVAEQMAARTGS